MEKKKYQYKENYSNSQIAYQTKKRAEKYKNFQFPIKTKNKLYYIENFCEHGNLLIDIGFFNYIYFQQNNNKLLYCDKCRDKYISELIISKEETKENRELLKNLYKKGSTTLKEKVIHKYHFKLYKSIIDNCKKDKNVEWNVKLFMFKENINEIPTCLESNCKEKTYFSTSNRKFTYFCKKHKGGYNSKAQIELSNYIDNYIKTKKLKFRECEIDIYIPELKLGIEYNGLYWHSSKQKDKYYHFRKWKFCKNKDIQLITIWEDDWQLKRNIVKSLINNKLQIYHNFINSNDCEIKIVSTNDAKYFLNNNHINGYSPASIKLGLYKENKLYSLMMFKNINDNYKLIRFCDLNYIDVKNSEITLFNYFLEKFKPKKVMYNDECDNENREMIKKLGFKKIGYAGINVWMSDNLNRFKNYKIKNLNLNEDKLYKIYGSNVITYEYINKN